MKPAFDMEASTDGECNFYYPPREIALLPKPSTPKGVKCYICKREYSFQTI